MHATGAPLPFTECPRAALLAMTPALARELRTDHAGEAGAVMIYRGVLAVSRDPALRAFAEQHLTTEQQHLGWIEALVTSRSRSRLLPLWRLAGWLTGALPALAGPRAVYATIEAVETFVDQHYAAQLALIDAAPGAAALTPLRVLLARCQHDEQAHRDDARQRAGGPARGLLALWTACVGAGSAAAVRVSRWV